MTPNMMRMAAITATLAFSSALSTPASSHDALASETATEAGFATKSNFNDAFKTEVGMTPTEFRNKA